MIPPGSSYGFLAQALISFIDEKLAEVRLPNKKGELEPIKVIDAYFDPEKYEDYDLPAVLIRTTAGGQSDGEHSEERSASVEIVLGTYLKDHGDHKFAVAVIDRIEQALLKQRIIDHKYRLKLPLNWAVPESTEQPWPYWWATMTANYYLPSIAEVKNEDGEEIDI